jgi:hypothetical protein
MQIRIFMKQSWYLCPFLGDHQKDYAVPEMVPLQYVLQPFAWHEVELVSETTDFMIVKISTKFRNNPEDEPIPGWVKVEIFKEVFDIERMEQYEA